MLLSEYGPWWQFLRWGWQAVHSEAGMATLKDVGQAVGREKCNGGAANRIWLAADTYPNGRHLISKFDGGRIILSMLSCPDLKSCPSPLQQSDWDVAPSQWTWDRSSLCFFAMSHVLQFQAGLSMASNVCSCACWCAHFAIKHVNYIDTPILDGLLTRL